MEVKSGFTTSEFWIQMVAHFAPMIAAYVMNMIAPGAPLAAAGVAAVTAVAGHFSASQYSDDRAMVKQAADTMTSRMAAVQAAIAAAPSTK